MSALVSFVLALPLALLAAWRARFLPWWPALVIAVGEISAEAVPGGYGLLFWALALGALSYALFRMNWSFGPESPAAAEPAV